MKPIQLARTILFVMILAAFQSCKKSVDEGSSTPKTTFIESRFDKDIENWTADFADYPVGKETFFELTHSHKFLPAPLDPTDGAFFISGNNHSDDLFMFLKREITNLKPNTSYTAKFSINFASNAPSNWAGVGGPPGEGVILGIGITLVEPVKIINGTYYRMNINKGGQANSGPDRKVIGNVANGLNEPRYVMLEKTGEFTFQTDNSGKVWASVSTDSGFEATTALYYSKIRIDFREN